MPIKNSDKIHRASAFLILLLLGTAPGIAQDIDATEPASPEAEEDGVVDAPSGEAVEEITVYGEKTVPAIKAQIFRADQRLYGIWNELNDDREFDVHCRLEGVYASRRKERVCLPAFEQGVLEESWDDLSTWTGAGRPEAEIRRKRQIMQRKMIEIAEQNPDLAAAIIERAKLQRDLVEAEARGDYGAEE
jgi:hypothetical protein